jgi:hypothetical protein
MQVVNDGTTTLTTRYYMGGAYEVTPDGTTETVRKYYSIARISVAMNNGRLRNFFSVKFITDPSADLGSLANPIPSSNKLFQTRTPLQFPLRLPRSNAGRTVRWGTLSLLLFAA